MTTTALSAPAQVTANHPEWVRLKAAATAIQAFQAQDGSVPAATDHQAAGAHVRTICAAVEALAPGFAQDRKSTRLNSSH